ncbi:hypothetical protein G7046_g7255 [Stylonectria norvegica]|nr:hypothetical protein G7046_g7255 [Stylonectria norvegica]
MSSPVGGSSNPSVAIRSPPLTAGYRPPQHKANLLRIRDNQRRSRARRREYLAELEQRIRSYELQGVEASAEVQLAARRVAEENRYLRNLLNRHGIDNDYIASYLQSAPTAQSGPQPITQFAHSSDTVQSLQHVIAPRRPPPIDPSIAYSVPPQGSREASIASVSTSSSSIWEPAQPMGPSYGRPPPANVPTNMGRPAIPSQLPTQQYVSQVFPESSMSRNEAYHPTQSAGPLMGDPRQQNYSLTPNPSNSNPTVHYNLSMNTFHPASQDHGPPGGC